MAAAAAEGRKTTATVVVYGTIEHAVCNQKNVPPFLLRVSNLST